MYESVGFLAWFMVTIIGYDSHRSILWNMQWYINGRLCLFSVNFQGFLKKKGSAVSISAINYDQQPTNQQN